MADHVKPIALPAVFDLDAFDGVRDRLLEALEAGPTRVHGAAVERVATNALMMLLAAADTAARNGFSLAITAPSAPLRAAIDRLGLTRAFSGLIEG